MKYRLRRKLRQSQEQLPEISLTPLIDTALTLLIIFMVTTPMLQKENALQVVLPKGNVNETQETQKEDLTVVITKKGEISFNDKIINEKDLIASGSEDSTIKIWNATSGQLVHTFNGHTDKVNIMLLLGKIFWGKNF